MTERVLIGIGVAALLALALWHRRSIGSAVTATTTRGVRALAEAIAKAEGYYVAGSIPSRRNNPGNLKLPHFGGDGIDAFPTAAEGWAALYRQIEIIASGRSAYYTPTMTIRQIGDVWAPSTDRNVPGAWARNVATALGVPVDTPIAQVLA